MANQISITGRRGAGLPILSSGSIVLPAQRQIFEIDVDDGEGVLTIRIRLEDSAEAGPRIVSQPVEPNIFELVLYNFNTPTARSIGLTPVGISRERFLLIALAVYAIDVQKVMHYTLYLGPASVTPEAPLRG